MTDRRHVITLEAENLTGVRALVYTEGDTVDLILAGDPDGATLTGVAAARLGTALVAAGFAVDPDGIRAASLGFEADAVERMTEAEFRTAAGWDAVEEGAAFERDLDAQAAADLSLDVDGTVTAYTDTGVTVATTMAGHRVTMTGTPVPPIDLEDVADVIGNALILGAPVQTRPPNSGSPADVLAALDAAGYRIVRA